MSACEHLHVLSDTTFPFHQHSHIATHFDRHLPDYSRIQLAKHIASVSTWTSDKLQGSASVAPFSYLHSLDADGRVEPSDRRPYSSSSDDSANMEHRPKQTKVTLPPLSSLTTSIDLDRRHETSSSYERISNQHSPSIASRNIIDVQDAKAHAMDVGSSAPTMSHSRRWSVDRSNARTSRPISAAYSPPSHKNATVALMAGTPSVANPAPPSAASPRPPKPSIRGIVESTRPRSYSSPHQNKMQNPTRRSSLADASEVDRLLEGLIFVQDINRRLDLNTGTPASPSIFHHADAAELLRNKLQEELNTMASFSQARAESVAKHLGLSAYLSPIRRAQEEASTQRIGLAAPIVSSGQAGHPTWQPTDPAERTQSSLGRLTLDERYHREMDYVHHSEAMESEYGGPRLEYLPGGQSAYASQPVHADSSHRSISRAISFEQPRSVQFRQQHPQHLEYGHAELARFDMDSRMQHDSVMRHTLGPPGLPSMYHSDGRHQQQMDLFDRRRLAGKGMKRVRKRKNEHHQECLGCQAKETPEWRKGPMGPRTLCNACGLLYAKLTKRKQQEAQAAAKASGKTAEEIVREREESPGAKQASLEALRAELNLANGMRNRATSSSMPSSNPNMLHPSHAAAAQMRPNRFHDGARGNASSSQPWPLIHRDNFQAPFAHQLPHHRPPMSSAGVPTPMTERADSRAMDGGMRPYSGGSIPVAPIQRHSDEIYLRTTSSRANSLGNVESFDQLVSRPMSTAAGPTRHLRPYSQGGPTSYPSPPNVGRQRSDSQLHPSVAQPYDRPESPNAPSASGPQRRHHPYM